MSAGQFERLRGAVERPDIKAFPQRRVFGGGLRAFDARRVLTQGLLVRTVELVKLRPEADAIRFRSSRGRLTLRERTQPDNQQRQPGDQTDPSHEPPSARRSLDGTTRVTS